MISRTVAPLIGLAWTGLLGACAGGGVHASTPEPSCALLGRDSVFASRAPVYRECAVDRKAHLVTTDIRTDFRSTTPRTTCYYADLEFVVDTTGRPEMGTAQTVRTNDQAFADAVFATLNRWKYEPALRTGVPVRQIVSAHKTLSAIVSVVVVPAGSPPPTPGKPTQRPPSC